MKKHLLFYVAGLTLSLALEGVVFGADAPPIDLNRALATLKSIKGQHTTGAKELESKAVQDIRAASASNATAIAFYVQAIASTQFAGKDPASFQAWKNREEDYLQSEVLQDAVRLHLNYLLLSIQRSQGMTTRQLEPALLAHIAALNAAGAKDAALLLEREKARDARDAKDAKDTGNKPTTRVSTRRPSGNTTPNGALNHETLFWAQDMIQQEIGSSIFVKWYGIEQMLANLKDWEPSPGHVDGIYQNTLLPYYRQNKDQKAVTYWDDKIQAESLRATNSRLTFRIEQFNNVRRPLLQWSRAEEEIAIGQRNRGMGEMLELIKTSPRHPDVADWIKKLEGMIASASAAIAAQPTPVPSATPDATAP